MYIAKGCTKSTNEEGVITLTCKSKKWDHEASNRASMIIIFLVLPILFFTILSANMGNFGIFMGFAGPIVLFYMLSLISKRADSVTIDDSEKILINYIPYKKTEIGNGFNVIDTPVDGSYISVHYKGNAVQVTGFLDRDIALQFCNEIRQSIASKK